MATSVLIGIDEYMKTSYRPDREYIDGEVVERRLGTFEHARIQALLAGWIGERERDWGAIGVTNWRTRVSGTRVRIPDLVLVKAETQPDVLEAPPIVVIEILSPDDSYSDTQRRAEDYRKMGVETIWIVDPQTRTGRICRGDAWVEAERLTVAGTEIYVELGAIFAALDGAR